MYTVGFPPFCPEPSLPETNEAISRRSSTSNGGLPRNKTSSSTPLPSPRPERLLSPERVFWTEVAANWSRSPSRTSLRACNPTMIMSAFAKVEMSSSLIDCWLSYGWRDGRRGQGHHESEGTQAGTHACQVIQRGNHPCLRRVHSPLSPDSRHHRRAFPQPASRRNGLEITRKGTPPLYTRFTPADSLSYFANTYVSASKN